MGRQLFDHELTLKSTYSFTSSIFFVISGLLTMRKRKKKEKELIKSQIAELSPELKNLKEMLEKHRTSDLFRESSTGRSDYEIKRSLQFYSDSHDDLNSFQARAARELESLSDLLSKIST